MAYLCGINNARNLTIFIIMIIVNYFIFEMWPSFTDIIREEFFYFVMLAHTIDTNQSMQQLGQSIQQINSQIKQQLMQQLMQRIDTTNNIALRFLTTYFLTLFRFVLSMVFVGSFLLRPLVIRPVSLVWARIVESDTPVFTVIFGGAAAFATAISEAAKHL
jgi:hypothetical protein